MEGKFLGLRHVAINVRNVPQSTEFYTKVLGMKVEWQPDEDNAYLTSGSDNLALHKLSQPADLTSSQRVDHIGFVVENPEDVDAWAGRLESLGVALEKQPKTHRDGARSLYFRDPDGLLIQLIYHPPISRQLPS